MHAYHYGPYGTYKIRNSDKTYVFLVVVSYTVAVFTGSLMQHPAVAIHVNAEKKKEHSNGLPVTAGQ